ncbi:MAG TPA: DUF1330 domain-containing protein [Bauldia sp.]|nr:DUF1330 domain-containing protein [Bauldia sp.]
MSKGYWIARAQIHDPEGYKKYLAANGAAFKKYGGRFLVRNGRYEALSGPARPRNVVIEFKDYETALACYHSPEYQHAIAERGNSADVDVLIVEGYDGPQPTD